MNRKKLFEYRDSTLYAHHTLTISPVTDDLSFKSHSHNMVEIYYFLRGNGRFVVEGNIYKMSRGNILVMAGGQTHNLLLEASAAYERMALLIDPAVIPREYTAIRPHVFEGSHFFELSSQEQIWFEEGFRLISGVQEEMRHDVILSFSAMIFAMLSTKINRPIPDATVEDSTVKQTIRYVNLHLSEELSLESIANALYCNKAVLNRKFRKMMGCSVWEYVVRRRIFSARQHLFFSGSIQEAFEKSGYHDYSSFFRAYKKLIGLSPSEDLAKAEANTKK